MSTQTLSSVASNVVGQYTQVGKLIIGTYRAGAQRWVAGANTRYANYLNARSLTLVNDAVKTSLIDAQQQIAGFVEGGITTGTHRADQVLDLIAGGVHAGIQRIAATAERVATAFDSNALTTVRSLTMPAAQVSLEFANRAVEGTRRLSERVIGADAPMAATAKRAAKKAVRRSRS